MNSDYRNFPQKLQSIPMGYHFPCKEPGSLVRLDYDTYESCSYESKSKVLQKTAYVYLPFGYSENKKYNVFYFMHGGWGNETTTMGTDKKQTGFKSIIDHAIQDGMIKPLIMVFPTYNNLSQSDSGNYFLALKLTQLYHNELVNDLMPAVEGKYSTYAENTTKEALHQSRDHRGFGGFSMGSVATWRTFEYCLNYFRYFLPMSGDLTDDGNYMDAIVKKSDYNWSDFFIVAITGTRDFDAADFTGQIEAMKKQTDSFRYADNEEDGNLTFRIKKGYAHDGIAAMEYTYNGLMWFWNHERNVDSAASN
jgi:enterochelin esterase-like enzyme